MRRLDFVVGSHMYPVARSSDSALTILTMMSILRIQILHYDDDDDDDDDRSFFHNYVKETSIIKYDDDDDTVSDPTMSVYFMKG